MREVAASCCDPGAGTASRRGGGAGRGGEAMKPGRVAFPSATFAFLVRAARRFCVCALPTSYGHPLSTCTAHVNHRWTNNAVRGTTSCSACVLHYSRVDFKIVSVRMSCLVEKHAVVITFIRFKSGMHVA
jgi:hypothetical protein